MNEQETRAELIDPKLKEDGWDREKNPEVKIRREYNITKGKIKTGGGREPKLVADYLLQYKGKNMAILEAKADYEHVGQGVAQAKLYAEKMRLDHTYATNGKEIYYINMTTAYEGDETRYHSPDELWNYVIPDENEWKEKFRGVPFDDKGGTMGDDRYYRDLAISKTVEGIAEKKTRLLLTLATGTGKTFIAFQIVWKLYQSRWNINYDGKRRPRVLFLADRNILADQAFNAFSSFPEEALIRIKPSEIRKKGGVPTNGAVFFTIFQTFMSGKDNKPYFGDYPADFFDLIIIDECHRGGANDESNWRGIMDYFKPAVQLGLTATPKREANIDTYKYFGEPIYTYSLKQGINDGFLTPYKLKKINTSLDTYIYNEDDEVDGEIEKEKEYKESDFNKRIEIKAREKKRVRILMDLINENDKTIVFCHTQEHAAAIRDLINQMKKRKEVNYCVRVTANDGEIGEQYLREFQDNEKSIPTILTTSRKLSTGIDARNVRNIVLLRPVNNIVEFKQIIGRGTRLYEGKNYFTIYDFVNASELFKDPEWDGEPEVCEACGQRACICDEEIKECEVCGQKPCICEKEEPEVCELCGWYPCICGKEPCPKCGEIPCECKREMIKVKLGKGRELEIDSTITTYLMGADGEPITIIKYLENLYGVLPGFFSTEEELRFIWSDPKTRETLLKGLKEAGYEKEELKTLQKMINAEDSDLIDVLEKIAFSSEPKTRLKRVAENQDRIFNGLSPEQKEFVDFILEKYIQSGEKEFEKESLPTLIELKYKSLQDAKNKFGDVITLKNLYEQTQKALYLTKETGN